MFTKSISRAMRRNQVPRAEFEALAEAIKGAYADTRHQVKAGGYNQRVVMTLFGQLLYHNVMQRVIDLKAICPSLIIYLDSNARGSAYHVVVDAGDLRFTISAVADTAGQPRYAHYREVYAQQTQLRMGGHPNLPHIGSKQVYLELLHVPKANDRQSFGSLVVASPNHRGEYLTGHMQWDYFLNTMYGSRASTGVEVIADPFASLSVIQPGK